MQEETKKSYDEMPYEGLAYAASHPETLAVTGRLRGLRFSNLESCRVLELGCAMGGNLIPMAYGLPGGRFVGLDLSGTQIAEGKRRVRALGFSNIELIEADILSASESLGEFDYIICHGVFSWVPETVRQGVLDVIRRLLAPAGIAFVSYNTNPGWALKTVLRDLMQFHVSNSEKTLDRAVSCRELLETLMVGLENNKSLYASMIKGLVHDILPLPDHYIVHEFLETDNQPLYFVDFMKRAQKHQLQFLGELRDFTGLGSISPAGWARIQEWAPDRIQREQYLDFFLNGTFRKTLLCHESVNLTRGDDPEAFREFRYSSRAQPENPELDVTSDAKGRFLLRTGYVVSTTDPVVKACLLVLYDAWPGAMTFSEIKDAVLKKTGGRLDPDDETLEKALFRCYQGMMVHLHVLKPRYVVRISDRPVASPVARYKAATGNVVSNLLHEALVLQDIDRRILYLLDGTRTLPEVRAALERDVRQGGIKEEELPASIEVDVQRLASVALLVA